MKKLFDGILFVSDMDGTILNNQGKISEKNKTALKHFMNNGGLFTFATGRSFSMVKSYLGDVAVNAPAILYNGAVLYDIKKEKAIWMIPLNDVVKDILVEMMKVMPDSTGIEIYGEEKLYYYSEGIEIMERFWKSKKDFTGMMPKDAPLPWVKTVLIDLYKEHEEVLKYLDNLPEGCKELIHTTRMCATHMELLSCGAGKGPALRKLADLCGIPLENVAAIGNYYNDMEMISLSNIGMVVENAPEDMKRSARFITSDNNHDALSDAVEFIESVIIPC